MLVPSFDDRDDAELSEDESTDEQGLVPTGHRAK